MNTMNLTLFTIKLRSPIIVTLIIFGFLLTSQAWASPRLKFELSNNYASPDDTLVIINAYLDNPMDKVAGLMTVLKLENSDVGHFTYIDPNSGMVDTTGTLISGWELLSASSPSGTNSDLKVIGLADYFLPPVTPPLFPQSGGILFRLGIRLNHPFPAMPDSMTSLQIDPDIKVTAFSDEIGNVIGAITETQIDTLYLSCSQYIGDSCLEWIEVDSALADTVVVDTSHFSYYDSAEVIFSDGSLRITEINFGDANGDGMLNIVDASFIINYIFYGGAQPQPIISGDANCDGFVNVVDASFIINFIFGNGLPPGCSP